MSRLQLYFLLLGLALAVEADDACFRNHSEFESLTGLAWYNRTLDTKAGRHGWWRSRLPFKPMQGESTLVAGVVYTHAKATLKLTVLFPPLHPDESRNVTLEVSTSRDRRRHLPSRTAQCNIKETTWHCTFRIDQLPTTRHYRFRVVYQPNRVLHPDLSYDYWGKIPTQVAFPKIAAMGCFGPDSTWEKPELLAAVLAQKPDLLVLQGDQVYGTDNLAYGFLELIHSIQNVTRRMPTVVQMDDHDYGLPNLFGAWNGDEECGAGFGPRPACVINGLQDMSMSHLPDRVNNGTLENGIDIRYTNYVYGSVDFAILEARKFKNYQEGDSLLGTEQEDWLRDWCSNNDGALRVVLAQTPFASLATNATNYYRGEKIWPVFQTPDSNGNPPEGRRRFMEIARNCTPLILSGDQHLGIAVTYDDYGVSECTSPATVNDIFWRINVNPINHSYVDGYGHPYFLHNRWNLDDVYWNTTKPGETRNRTSIAKARRADGFLVVVLDGATATCEMRGYRNFTSRLVWSALRCRSTRPETKPKYLEGLMYIT